MNILLLSGLLLISGYSFATDIPAGPKLQTLSHVIYGGEDPYITETFNGNTHSMTKEEYIQAPVYQIKFVTYQDDKKISQVESTSKSNLFSNFGSYQTTSYVKSINVINDNPVQELGTITHGYGIIYKINESQNKNEVSFIINYHQLDLLGLSRFSDLKHKELWIDLPESETREFKQNGYAVLGKELDFLSWTTKKPGMNSGLSKISIKIEINKVD